MSYPWVLIMVVLSRTHLSMWMRMMALLAPCLREQELQIEVPRGSPPLRHSARTLTSGIRRRQASRGCGEPRWPRRQRWHHGTTHSLVHRGGATVADVPLLMMCTAAIIAALFSLTLLLSSPIMRRRVPAVACQGMCLELARGDIQTHEIV